LNKGKDWNSLVYGVYPNYQSAKLALEDLPATVRKARPWIRRLKNIQKEITEANN
jgi:septal ring-binding cell division protein DamX